MENHANISNDSGNDRLSELPDEILHSILRRLDSPNQAAQTAALSTRWRSLWLSYPVAEFDSCNGDRDSGLKKFCIATLRKFSRDELMRMDSLKVSGQYNCYNLSSRIFRQLVDLACKRKAEKIVFEGIRSRLVLKLGSISNSCAKILRLENIFLRNDDRPLSLNCLRSLRLSDVEFKDERIFADLIAGSPLLETLELINTYNLSKIRVSNLANLKMLAIDDYYNGIEEIEIAAPRLKLLRLTRISEELKIDVTAPQLNVLDIAVHSLDMDYLNAVLISRLQQLKSLTVAGEFLDSPKLKFSNSMLEEFNLRAPVELEEIELCFGPHMRKFSLTYNDTQCGLKKCGSHYSSADCQCGLRKCEIHNAPADCRWEVDYQADDDYCGTEERFVKFKSFITRFARFDTVTVCCVDYTIPNRIPNSRRFRNLELGWSELPKAIKHLKIAASGFLEADEVAVVCEGLFWACRPTFLTIICKDLFSDQCPKLLPHFLSALNVNKKGFDELRDWQLDLKDVQIVTKGVHRDIEDEETEKGLMTVSEDLIKMHDARDQICFKLTWL